MFTAQDCVLLGFAGAIGLRACDDRVTETKFMRGPEQFLLTLFCNCGKLYRIKDKYSELAAKLVSKHKFFVEEVEWFIARFLV